MLAPRRLAPPPTENPGSPPMLQSNNVADVVSLTNGLTFMVYSFK